MTKSHAIICRCSQPLHSVVYTGPMESNRNVENVVFPGFHFQVLYFIHLSILIYSELWAEYSFYIQD